MSWWTCDLPSRNDESRGRRMTEDEGQCLQCGGVDDEVSPCAGFACDALLHRLCGTRCESCGDVLCTACIEVFDDCNYCPQCLIEARYQNGDAASVLEEEWTLA